MGQLAQGNSSYVLTLRVSRTLEVFDGEGSKRDFALQKSKALLAILALSPEFQMSTARVVELLWPDRSASQANGSLRQCRTDIRRAFSPYGKALCGEGKIERLDHNLVQISRVEGDLLADLPMSTEPMFRAWLDEHPSQIRPNHEPRLSVSMMAHGEPSSHAATVVGDLFAATLRDLGGGPVSDLRKPMQGMFGAVAKDAIAPGPGIMLLMENLKGGARLRLVTVPDGAVIDSLDLPDGADEPLLYARANRLAFIAYDWLTRADLSRSDWQAASLCVAGMNALFGLEPDSEKAASQLFDDAYETAPNGLFLAWQAYACTFAIAERRASCVDTERDQAQALARRAREMAPWNSYVLALTAHVETICRRSYLSAFELAQRSLDLNRSNPIAWGTLGVAKCHLGEVEDGLRHTQWASSIGQHAPYRYQLDAWTCVAATIARDFPVARAAAERSHAMSENFAPPLRYLSALLLEQGRPEEAITTVQKLSALEPGFQFSDLKEKNYPAAGLHRSGLSGKMPNEL
ncbi:MAG: hypothetical protein AB8B85_09925 [Paracoccaceae bacterium]